MVKRIIILAVLTIFLLAALGACSSETEPPIKKVVKQKKQVREEPIDEAPESSPSDTVSQTESETSDASETSSVQPSSPVPPPRTYSTPPPVTIQPPLTIQPTTPPQQTTTQQTTTPTQTTQQTTTPLKTEQEQQVEQTKAELTALTTAGTAITAPLDSVNKLAAQNDEGITVVVSKINLLYAGNTIKELIKNLNAMASDPSKYNKNQFSSDVSQLGAELATFSVLIDELVEEAEVSQDTELKSMALQLRQAANSMNALYIKYKNKVASAQVITVETSEKELGRIKQLAGDFDIPASEIHTKLRVAEGQQAVVIIPSIKSQWAMPCVLSLPLTTTTTALSPLIPKQIMLLYDVNEDDELTPRVNIDIVPNNPTEPLSDWGAHKILAQRLDAYATDIRAGKVAVSLIDLPPEPASLTTSRSAISGGAAADMDINQQRTNSKLATKISNVAERIRKKDYAAARAEIDTIKSSLADERLTPMVNLLTTYMQQLEVTPNFAFTRVHFQDRAFPRELRFIFLVPNTMGTPDVILLPVYRKHSGWATLFAVRTEGAYTLTVQDPEELVIASWWASIAETVSFTGAAAEATCSLKTADQLVSGLNTKLQAVGGKLSVKDLTMIIHPLLESERTALAPPPQSSEIVALTIYGNMDLTSITFSRPVQKVHLYTSDGWIQIPLVVLDPMRVSAYFSPALTVQESGQLTFALELRGAGAGGEAARSPPLLFAVIVLVIVYALVGGTVYHLLRRQVYPPQM